ncbi:MAG: hypothetical protein H6867_08440 [Rhodospirillales bacterium]|nr:hypothetical protein [Rhodospirillales bacterium]MCB9995581.1 hypothetical protein [Rhodospirillales bacterium]
MESSTEVREGFEPVLWYFGGIVTEDGTPKALWTEPGVDSQYLDEIELNQKYHQSMRKLNPQDSDRNRWRHYRNMNYSAEYALQHLQDEKRRLGIELDLPYSPVVAEGSAIYRSATNQGPSMQ